MMRKMDFILTSPVRLLLSAAYDDDYEETPQEKLEQVIMEDVLLTEKNDGIRPIYVDNISEDVEEKLKELLEKIPRNN